MLLIEVILSGENHKLTLSQSNTKRRAGLRAHSPR